MFIRRLFIASVACMLAAGCASSIGIDDIYRDVSFDGAPFSRILVVGIHDDANLRRRFEDGLVRSLARSGTSAVSSVVAMGSRTALSRDTLVAAADETDADGVLITRLLDSQVRAELDRQTSSTRVDRRNNIPIADFFRYEYTEIEDPMSISTIGSVSLVSDLYSVATGTRVWSAQSTAVEKREVLDVIEGVADALATRLRREGLIP
jgi:hypothetical protein